jgi:uncharacterized protein (TIGR02646 family)
MKKVTKNFSVLALRKDQFDYETKLLQEKKPNQGCWARVQKDLAELYNYKCAYCEIDLRKTTTTVEHYRPKAKDKYFWLAHEWTNFMPCCPDCQDDKKGKGSQFETENPPQYAPPLLPNGSLDYEKCRLDNNYLLSEKPLILNPEMDSPAEHLGFNTQNGELLPKNNSKKAEATIRIVNLNRKQLQFSRKQIIDNFFEKINHYYEVFSQEKIKEPLQLALKIVKSEVAKQANTQAEFSFVWQYVFDNFEAILQE